MEKSYSPLRCTCLLSVQTVHVRKICVGRYHRRQRRRGRRGPDSPKMFDLQGSINVLDNPSPPIISTQSHVRCTIFVNIIDLVVSAVVEQVYSSTFQLCLLKMQEIWPLKRFTFTSNCTKMRLVAGLCPDPLGELTALPHVP